jgi:hypothetical protein
VYESDEVEEMYCVTEEILEKGEKGVTNTILMVDCNTVFGDKSYGNTDRMDSEGEIREFKCSLTSVKEITLK